MYPMMTLPKGRGEAQYQSVACKTATRTNAAMYSTLNGAIVFRAIFVVVGTGLLSAFASPVIAVAIAASILVSLGASRGGKPG